MKRNKHTGRGGASIPDMMFKQLFKYFGFPYHTAPGEAEAECALLQREGLVDAVLSEDVDTLMFGCGVTLRNWSSEAAKGKIPTHVNVYDAQVTKQGKSGLDREGMILVALLSGGDYDTDGVRGFGAKVACQAARAGFGKSLCRISRNDAAGYAKWREDFNHEVRTNESKFFRSKHKTLKLPDDFPKMDILGYYTHPVVSNARGVAKLRDELTWDGEINILGLRKFVADAFEWRYKVGANKFIRGLGPVLLIHKLRERGDRRASGFGDITLTAMKEMELVRTICGKREHISTDNMPEMRVIIHPNDIVGLDLDAEEEFTEDYGRDGLAPLLEDDQVELYASDEGRTGATSPTKRAVPAFDPTQPEKVWISETIAKIGIPLKVEDYEETLRNPRKFIKQKAKEKQAAARKAPASKMAAKSGMSEGAMEKFVNITKAVSEAPSSTPERPSKPTHSSSQPNLPPMFLAPTLARPLSSQPITRPASTQAVRTTRKTRTSSKVAPAKIMAKFTASSKEANAPIRSDPWSLSKSRSTRTQMDLSMSRTTTKPSKPSPTTSSSSSQRQAVTSMPIDLCSSSPVREPTTPSRKHAHSPHLSEEEPPPTPSYTKASLSTSANHPLTPERDFPLPSPRKKRTPRLSSPDEQNTAADSSSPNTSGYSSKSFNSSSNSVSKKLDFAPLVVHEDQNQDKPANNDAKHSQKTVDLSTFSSPTRPARMFIKPDDSMLLSSPITPTKFYQEPSAASRNADAEGAEVQARDQVALRGQIMSETPRQKKYILLRDSLPGTWKEVARDQLVEGRSRAWRRSGIEVVDLSASAV